MTTQQKIELLEKELKVVKNNYNAQKLNAEFWEEQKNIAEGKLDAVRKWREEYFDYDSNVKLTMLDEILDAPALPEDEECEVIEVVKIPEFYIDELNLTKPDGKKLKIKVVKKQ